MTPDSVPTNLPASVRARLQNYAKANQADSQQVLMQYVLERFLYRLGKSEYRDRFVVKGPSLFMIWLGHRHRPTMDLDMLGLSMSSSGIAMEMVRGIVRTAVLPDGLEYLPDTISAQAIREEARYRGTRINLTAMLGSARIPVHIDVGFGDIVKAENAHLNSILDLPEADILAYPRESLIAEKFETIVNLGLANSRLKDYFDIYYLACSTDFDYETLSSAIVDTFSRRQTTMPASIPDGLSQMFSDQPDRQQQWTRFCERIKLSTTPSLEVVVDVLARFLMPMWGPIHELIGNKLLWSYLSLSWESLEETIKVSK